MKFLYNFALISCAVCAPLYPDYEGNLETGSPGIDAYEYPNGEETQATQGTQGNGFFGGTGSTQPPATLPWNGFGGQGGQGGQGGSPFGGMIPTGGNQGNNGFGGQNTGFGGQNTGFNNGFGNQNNGFGNQNTGLNGQNPFNGGQQQGNNGFLGGNLFPTTASWIGQQGNGIFPGNNNNNGFNGQNPFNGGNQGINNGFGGQQGGQGGVVTDITGPLTNLLQNVLNTLKSLVSGLGNTGTDMSSLVSQLLNPSLPQQQKQTLVQNALNSIQDVTTKSRLQQVTNALASASTQLQGQSQQAQQAVSQILSLPFDQQFNQLPVQQQQSQLQTIVRGLSQQDDEAVFLVMNRLNVDVNKPATL